MLSTTPRLRKEIVCGSYTLTWFESKTVDGSYSMNSVLVREFGYGIFVGE